MITWSIKQKSTFSFAFRSMKINLEHFKKKILLYGKFAHFNNLTQVWSIAKKSTRKKLKLHKIKPFCVFGIYEHSLCNLSCLSLSLEYFFVLILGCAYIRVSVYILNVEINTSIKEFHLTPKNRSSFQKYFFHLLLHRILFDL